MGWQLKIFSMLHALNLIKSILQFGVIYWLFAIVCVETLGSWGYPIKFVKNTFEFWCNLSVIWHYLSERGPGCYLLKTIEKSSCILVYFISFYHLLFSEVRKEFRCHLNKFFYNRSFSWILSVKPRFNSWIHSSFDEADNCNRILAGISKYQLVCTAAACFECGRLADFRLPITTPLLRDRLHWLLVLQRINFKLCLMVFKVLQSA